MNKLSTLIVATCLSLTANISYAADAPTPAENKNGSMMAMPMPDKQMQEKQMKDMKEMQDKMGKMKNDMKDIETKMMKAKTMDDMKKVMQLQMEMEMKMLQECMDMMNNMQTHMMACGMPKQ
jgi:hypothetical protein